MARRRTVREGLAQVKAENSVGVLPRAVENARGDVHDAGTQGVVDTRRRGSRMRGWARRRTRRQASIVGVGVGRAARLQAPGGRLIARRDSTVRLRLQRHAGSRPGPLASRQCECNGDGEGDGDGDRKWEMGHGGVVLFSVSTPCQMVTEHKFSLEESDRQEAQVSMPHE